jgi:predicted phosphodiesterase
MVKKPILTSIVLGVSVIAVVAAGMILFGLSRGTDNGPLSAAPLFTFAAAGDFGANDNTRDVLQEIARHRTDFTVALGDLSYGKTTEQQWCSMVTSALGQNHPVELVAGNHDDKEGSTYGKFLECLPNKIMDITGDYGVQYAFTYKNAARFIAVAPGLTIQGKTYQYSSGTPEYDWLVQQIDDARKDGIPWVIVGMHKVCVTMGEKTCEIGPSLFNVLVEKKVDLILQGHEHGYMRTKQLTANAGSCPAQGTGSLKDVCAADNDTAFRKGKGPVLIINGSGGAEMRAINLASPDKPYFADWHGANSDPTYGPVIVGIWADKLEARFMNTKGEQKDVFTITNYDL